MLLLAAVCKCCELTLLCCPSPSLTACFCSPRHASCNCVLVLGLMVCLTDACLSLLDFLMQTQRVKMRRSLTRTLRLRVRVLRMTMRTAKGPATQMRRMLTST